MKSRTENIHLILRRTFRNGGGWIILVGMLAVFGMLMAPIQGAAAEKLPQTPETGDITWEIHNVDAPKHYTNMTDRSMRFDSTGKAHVAFGGDHLYYAWFDGTNWQTTTVDSSQDVGQYAALALDTYDRPRISYYDSANRSLKFAYMMNNIWYIQTLDTAPVTPIVA